MDHVKNSTRRTFIALFVAYMLLTSQLTPLVFAFNSKRELNVAREQSSDSSIPKQVVAENIPGLTTRLPREATGD